MTKPTPKPWYQSATLWFNLAMTVLAGVEANFQLLRGTIPTNWYERALFVVIIVNVILRFKTSQPITIRSPDQ